MKSVGMAEEKLNVLYTIDDKEFPSMDYINVLEKTGKVIERPDHIWSQ